MKFTRYHTFGLELGIAVSILLFYYFYWGSVANFVASIEHCGRLFCDFYKIFYPMGENILTMKSPVRYFYYSPFSALLFLPYGMQPRSAAMILWGATLLAGVVGTYAYWLPSMQKNNLPFKLLYLFLLLTTFPLLHNIKWGQVSIFIVLSLFLVIELYQSGKWVLSSFWLAFAVTLKFYPIIFLLYFIFKRDLKFLFAFAAFTFLLAVVIPVMFIGIDPTVNFYLEVLKNPQPRATFIVLNGDPGASTSQYFPRVALRLLGGTLPGFWLLFIQGASLLILGANILMTLLVSNSTLADRVTWSFLLLFASVAFFVPTSWAHYFVFLPAFQAWMFFTIKRDNMFLSALKYILLFISIVLSSSLFYIFFDSRQLYAFRGFVFWSNLLLIVAAYIELTPQLKLSEFTHILKQWLPAKALPQRKHL